MATHRGRLYEIIEQINEDDQVSFWFDSSLMILILLNVFAVVFQTMPVVMAHVGPALNVFEMVSVTVFTVELFGRMWVAVQGHSTFAVLAVLARCVRDHLAPAEERSGLT